MMTKYKGIQDPKLVEMLHFFDPPLTDDDGEYRCLNHSDLIAGMERSAEFRALILSLPAPAGRMGQIFKFAHDLARTIDARQAAMAALGEFDDEFAAVAWPRPGPFHHYRKQPCGYLS